LLLLLLILHRLLCLSVYLSLVNSVIPLFHIISKGNHIFFIQKPQWYSRYPNEH
jgi:hypothetical protein